MNRLYKISLGISVLAAINACGGGSGSSNSPSQQPISQPVTAPVSPYGAAGGPVNPAGTLPQAVVDNPSTPNYAKDASGNRLVINKQLRFSANAGIAETLQQDSCNANSPQSYNRCLYPSGTLGASISNYCAIPVNTSNMILAWDQAGRLQITSFNDFGNAQNSQPLLPGSGYTVDDNGQITISQFQLNGYPSTSYIASKNANSSYGQFMSGRTQPFSMQGFNQGYNPSQYNNLSNLSPGAQQFAVGGNVNGSVFGNPVNANQAPGQYAAQGTIMINGYSGLILSTMNGIADPSGQLGAHMRSARLVNPAELDASIMVNASGNTTCETDIKSFVVGEMN